MDAACLAADPACRATLLEGCSRIALCLIARSARCDVRWGCRRLRRICRNGKALFRQLLLQIGGANIERSAAVVGARRGRTPLLPSPPRGGVSEIETTGAAGIA